MPIIPKLCCDKMTDMYVRHKAIWNGYKGNWFIGIKEQRLFDDHILMEQIRYCPFCGSLLENTLKE